MKKMSVLESHYFLIYYRDHTLVNITSHIETLFMTFPWINCASAMRKLLPEELQRNVACADQWGVVNYEQWGNYANNEMLLYLINIWTLGLWIDFLTLRDPL